MNQNHARTQPDVFEMILQSVGGEPSSAQAVAQEPRQAEEWVAPQEEGQLAVDVADIGHELLVISTMAGAQAEKIEVYVHDDLLTIRGVRARPVVAGDIEYFHEECFWGPFSRTIVLPVDVNGHKARAEYRSGVLMVYIPKRDTDARIPVTVVDE